MKEIGLKLRMSRYNRFNELYKKGKAQYKNIIKNEKLNFIVDLHLELSVIIKRRLT